ncbi:MAG: PhoH family protein [Opitutales bacterium]|nr:PhoH family protein [Opitutales bacterium]MCH8541751.1 PhoH family protein [Opitutales bacterium]
MSEITLHFDNPRQREQLYRGKEELLEEAERKFGVTLVAREEWIRAEGEEPGLQRTKTLFEILQMAREQGLRISSRDFSYILEGILNERTEDLRNLFAESTVISVQRKTIVPKTFGQKGYLKAILSSQLTFGIGPAGTGKTYLAMACAVSALLKGEVQRIILTRPAVEAGEALGFLPGDLKEKILPYLRPLYDALNDMIAGDEMAKLVEKGVIEIAPLAYMRGRTLSKSFIILDEAQNTTVEQMMMFLTRIGEDSQVVVTGDVTQVDLPRSRQSGLIDALRVLENVPEIAFYYLRGEDVVRHPLVRKIIEAYQEEREKEHPRGTPTAKK